jgi:hypothetical protein
MILIVTNENAPANPGRFSLSTDYYRKPIGVSAPPPTITRSIADRANVSEFLTILVAH